MKISSKARYGLKLCYALAESYGKCLSVTALAAETGATAAYLEQLAMLLKKGGLIGSERGAQGGYYLLKAPGETDIAEIFVALEGDVLTTECNTRDCRNYQCPTRSFFDVLHEEIEKLLKGMTLQTLLDGNRKRETENFCTEEQK